MCWRFRTFSPHRLSTHSFQHSLTPTHSPARRKRRMGSGMQRVKTQEKDAKRWMMSLPYHLKLQDWWKCIAVPLCCHGRPVCLRRSLRKPLATSSSSPTPPCSTLCWREVRGNTLNWWVSPCIFLKGLHTFLFFCLLALFRWAVFMVQSRPDPYKLGPCSWLATGGRIRWHSLWVYEETFNHRQLSVYSQDPTHPGNTATFINSFLSSLPKHVYWTLSTSCL